MGTARSVVIPAYNLVFVVDAVGARLRHAWDAKKLSGAVYLHPCFSGPAGVAQGVAALVAHQDVGFVGVVDIRFLRAGYIDGGKGGCLLGVNSRRGQRDEKQK